MWPQKQFCKIFNGLIYLLLFIPIVVNANERTFDHEVFLKEMENSNDRMYQQILNKYETYLEQCPNDVPVWIQKCQFIQLAQYDEYEECNPNQAAFDSCVAYLNEQFPNHPDVLLFQISNSWGDERKEMFQKANHSIKQNQKTWSTQQRGELYATMSTQYYWEDSVQQALMYMKLAIAQDESHGSSVEYARLLVDVDQKEEALEVLGIMDCSTVEIWQLNQMANLYLTLEAYDSALEVFQKIGALDSSYVDNLELANTLEGIGEYNHARSYLLTDTTNSWDRATALKNLLFHDLKYQDGDVCLSSYNAFRDMGFIKDPLALYRLKLFFAHPFMSWKLRDLGSLLLLVFILVLLLLLPSIWILPIHFVGHRWHFFTSDSTHSMGWGLKAFWLVSAGYLLASFLASMTNIEYLYSLYDDSIYLEELDEQNLGFMTLVFILIFACFGLATLHKMKFTAFISPNWSIRRSIWTGVGFLLLYRLMVGVYVRIGVTHWGLTLDELTTVPHLFLSSKQEIMALVATYGKWVGLLVVCLLVPVYEEVVFRGVILESCQHYIRFHAANVIQAALFAMVHMNLFLFPVFFLFGIIAGMLRKKSGGLLSGAVFHVFNNLLAMVWMLTR
jgi:membrane protease YdiL (CAAX protease family)